MTKMQKKILFFIEKYGINKLKDYEFFNLGHLDFYSAKKIYDARNDEDEFLKALKSRWIISTNRTSQKTKDKKLALRQNSFRSRKKEDYSMTQIYIEKDLKQRFKDDCIKKDISMQDAFNGLLRDYLV